MYVAYYRVSTARQGTSGLGLEAQQTAVERFAGATPIVESFTEIESGRKADRPQLRAAIAACKKHGATLLIARLDRLARNVAFVSGLMESGCEFQAVDLPAANRLTIHVLAAVAENEARCISDRTRVALGAAKARGVKLGAARDPGLYAAARGRGAANNAKAAADVRERVHGKCRSLRDAGRSLEEIAAVLNQAGERTRRGLPYSATAVYRVLGGVSGGHAGRF